MGRIGFAAALIATYLSTPPTSIRSNASIGMERAPDSQSTNTHTSSTESTQFGAGHYINPLSIRSKVQMAGAAAPVSASASSSDGGGGPPPPAPQPPTQQSLLSKINDFLHRDYITDVAFYGFWLGFWLLMPVPIFWGTLAWALYDLCTIRGYRQPCGPVLVTGCEGLFGRDLVLRLAEKGWKVLAACQTEAAVGTYAGVANVQAFKMDLSNEQEVQAVAARLRREELAGGLYALVCNNNNTVVGKDGLVEWMAIENYQWQMEVNLYGFIRATKAFLPLLKGYVKRDEKQRLQQKARIVILNSNAGVVPGQPNASCYAAAKHACDGWLNSLRIEAKVWGIEVAAVCPCWHEIEIEYFDHDVFATLPREVQEEYGREYFDGVVEGAKKAIQPIMWRSSNVTHALVHAVTAERQRPYVVVGWDGRFLMSPLLLLPRRVFNVVIDTFRPFNRTPAALQPGAALKEVVTTAAASAGTGVAQAGATR